MALLEVGTKVRYSPSFLLNVSKKWSTQAAEKRGIVVETEVPGAPASFVRVRWQGIFEETRVSRSSDLIVCD